MMKRRIAFLCVLILLISLAGCQTAGHGGSAEATGPDGVEAGKTEALDGETVSPEESVTDRPVLELASMYIYESDKGNKTVYVHGSHDALRLNAESEKKYPALSEALARYTEEETKEVNKRKNEYASRYITSDDARDMAPEGFEITDRLYVRRADSRVLSVLETGFDFGGGVHGYFGYYPLNLDSQTGDEIQLSDVITDKSRLADLLKSRLKEENSEDSFFEGWEETIDKETEEVKEDDMDWKLSWTLDPQGITFYFNPYDIGPWAAGAFTTTILYDSEKGLINEKYLPEEGAGYLCGFDGGRDQFADVDGDGKTDRISVDFGMDSAHSDAFTEMTVAVNDKEVSKGDLYAYSVMPRLVFAEDGRTYLYVWGTSDNDYVEMYLFDLSSGSPVDCGSKPLAEDWTYEEGDNLDYSAWKTLAVDPAHMVLGTRFDLLSTYTATKNYYVDQSPVPESKDKVYTIKGEITLVSKKEISVPKVDKNGKAGETIKVPAGSNFTLKYTDGESAVDALLDDGTLVRFTVTGPYPPVIDGTDANELFEQLYYAG